MHSIFQLMLLVLPAANAPGIDTYTSVHKAEQTQPQLEFENVTRNRVPVLQGVWTLKPSIVICDGVVRKSRVEQAVRFWERLGYEFGEITNNNDPIDCMSEEIGTIKIMLPSSDTPMENNLAITTTFRILETNENIRSNIVIHSFAVNKPLVLEHEIGHALGLESHKSIWTYYESRI